MIRYDLQCDAGHGFDGWFRNSEAYERQAESGVLACPACGSTRVGKALMAPRIAKATRAAEAPEPRAPEPRGTTEEQQPVVMPDPRALAVAELFRRIREEVKANADYVGERFPEEARRIHYEEIEPRGIYGEATADEAAALHEEGIEVYPLPPLPEERN